MTKDEILNMEAGSEMDALVAEKVMGYREIESPSSWWFMDRNWRGLADEIYWTDSFGTVKASINGYQQFRPSIDIAAAWEVVEKFDSFQVHKNGNDERHYSELKFEYGKWANWQANADTAPLAICRAALLAVLD